METQRVMDGDGHVLEDLVAIGKRMPGGFVPRGAGLLQSVFPPPDHLHASQPLQLLEGSFEKVGPEGWIEFLDGAGLAYSALYPTWGLHYGFITNRDWAIAACRAYNDWLHDTYLKRDKRFIGMAIIPMQEPAAAVKELRRCVTRLGMKGAVLPSNGLPNPLGAKCFWPVYEEANRLGCAIAVHGGPHNRMGLDDLDVFAAVNALGHPFGQMIAFASMLTNGLFDRYPEVRFAFLEGGVSWLTVMLERFPRAWETHIPLDPRGESVRLDAGEGIGERIASLIRDGRIFVGCEGDEPFIADVARHAGGAPAFFSTDFPHETTRERCLAAISTIKKRKDLKPDDRQRVLFGNAARLYGVA
jgi:predicted TIM-barrel fold metal-dependent hydrolase